MQPVPPPSVTELTAIKMRKDRGMYKEKMGLGPSSPRVSGPWCLHPYVLPCLSRSCRCFFINFLYLCFFILSFLCRFTLIACIVPR